MKAPGIKTGFLSTVVADAQKPLSVISHDRGFPQTSVPAGLETQNIDMAGMDAPFVSRPVTPPEGAGPSIKIKTLPLSKLSGVAGETKAGVMSHFAAIDVGDRSNQDSSVENPDWKKPEKKIAEPKQIKTEAHEQQKTSLAKDDGTGIAPAMTKTINSKPLQTRFARKSLEFVPPRKESENPSTSGPGDDSKISRQAAKKETVSKSEEAQAKTPFQANSAKIGESPINETRFAAGVKPKSPAESLNATQSPEAISHNTSLRSLKAALAHHRQKRPTGAKVYIGKVDVTVSAPEPVPVPAAPAPQPRPAPTAPKHVLRPANLHYLKRF